MSRERLWELVHEAWDERRDPLQDERVQRIVEEDPDSLVELARVERALRETKAWRAGLVRKRWIVSAAAVGLLGLGGWAIFRLTRPAPPEPAPTFAARSVPTCAVLACRVTIEHADERGTEILRAENGTRTRTFVARDGTRIESAVCTAFPRNLETSP